MRRRLHLQRGLLLLTLTAFLLQMGWTPLHLALEHHHDEDLAHAEEEHAGHDHAIEHPRHADHDAAEEGSDHDPHPARDHGVELIVAPAPLLALCFVALPVDEVGVHFVATGAVSTPPAASPLPRGRSPGSSRSRAPPSC